jgi:hypothetical protein
MLHNYVAVAASHFAKRLLYREQVSSTNHSETLENLIAKCVADTYAGHAFVQVDQPLSTELSHFLDAMPVTNRPLMLWQNRLYLSRYFYCEERLAKYLELQTSLPEQKKSDFEAALNRFLPADEKGFNNGQRDAVLHALQSRFTVVSGGPGTGKTTTVRALLQCFRELHPQCRIALVAPTGKAASRLSEADSGPKPARAEVSTLHRLIGRKPNGSVGFDAKKPLPHDLIVVDEASMIDLVLADQLIVALQPNTHLVLLGDANQLDAVETGTFFHELCRSHPANRRWLRRLTHTYRFDADSMIAGAAKAIETGESDQLSKFIEPIAWQPTLAQIEQLAQGYDAYVSEVIESRQDDALKYDANRIFQALSQ